MCGCKDKKKCGCKTKFVACVGPKGDKGDTGPQGPPGDMFYEIRVPLTASQVRGSHTTPISLVAAPGTGKLIVPISCQLRRQYVSTPYSSNGYLITENPASGGIFITSSSTFLSSAEGTPGDSIITDMVQTGIVSPLNYNLFENTPLYFQAGSTDSVSGDDLVFVYVTYKIITL